MFYRKLVEMFVGKSTDIRQKSWNNYMTREELRNGMDFVREHIYYIRPPKKFTREAVHDLYSNSIARYGGDIIITDPVNRMVKDKTHLRDDEYLVEYYDTQGTFAQEFNVCAVNVTHLTKPEKIANGVPSRPSKFNLLGGQAAGNATDDILLLHQPNADRLDTTREVIVDKVRNKQLVGEIGTVELKYNYRKRRYMGFLPDGEEYDPFIGSKLNSARTMPIILPNQEFDTTDDYVPY